jgi:2-oxoglutarate dehydrogenase E1 component
MREFRKPLILMTPKSLLRHKRCVSSLEEMADGSTFHRFLWDDEDAQLGGNLPADNKIKRVVMCSGKVYYDLLEEREKRGLKDVYLLRIEQLYPFATGPISEELARFPNADILWCQEEPRNMGSWNFIREPLENTLNTIGRGDERIKYSGRSAAASPATGSAKIHAAEQIALVDGALTIGSNKSAKKSTHKTSKKPVKKPAKKSKGKS